MKALVFHGPFDLTVEDRPVGALHPDWVRIRVEAVGICGSDLHGYTGENGRRFPGQVMGHEFSGFVVEIGAQVDPAHVRIGGLVTANPVFGCGACSACVDDDSYDLCDAREVLGVEPAISAAFAEFVDVPAGNLVLLPAGLAPAIGTLVEPLAVGYRAARRGGVANGSRVLVTGGGPIGQAAAIAARRLGGTVVVSESAPARRDLLARVGFASVDPRSGGFHETVRAALGGPAQIVIDAVGIDATVRDAVELSEPGATIVLVGMGSPLLSLSAYEISTKERLITGSFCYSRREFIDAANWVAQHESELLPLIDHTVSLDGAAAAFSGLADGTLNSSKTVVLMEAGR